MVAAVLFASLVGLVVFSAWLLVRGKTSAGRLTHPAARACSAVLVAACPAAVLPAFGATTPQTVLASSVGVVGTGAWLWGTRRWSLPARLAWSFAVLTGAAFLTYTAIWTVTSPLSPLGRAGGFVLWLLELISYVMALAFLWELIDAVGSIAWLRRTPEGATRAQQTDGPFPFVSLHVPAHNEPPEMVIETIRSLERLDYPNFEIIVLDNNTTDDSLWQPVAEFCATAGPRVKFHRLVDWPGYKSGALNFGLTVTDPAVEVVGVVDSDYLADPQWLRVTAPMFADEKLAFIQSPQDYRDWRGARYFRNLYHSYDYFFRVSQRSRDERDSAIFGGTMGLVRRSALESVGRWSEWCITEDAELSLRLHKAGWTGRHVDASLGRGVMPLTFEALKGQRFRWCFGGVQILKLHWRSLMPWDRDPDNHLTQSQRLAYLIGGLQWFGDILAIGFLIMLVSAAIDSAFGGSFVIRRLSPVLLDVVPAMVAVGFVRAVAGIRRAGTATWGEAVGALGIWMALSLTVARACIRGVIEKNGVFLRTPKTRGNTSLGEAMRLNRSESIIGIVCVVSAVVILVATPSVGTGLIAGLLLLNGTGYLLAPASSLAARRADLSDELSERRAAERTRGWAIIDRTRVRRGALILAFAFIGLLLLLVPPTADSSTPPLGQAIGTRHGFDGHPARTTSTGIPSQGSSTSSQSPAPGQVAQPSGTTAPSSGTSTSTHSTSGGTRPSGTTTTSGAATGGTSTSGTAKSTAAPTTVPSPTTAPGSAPTSKPTQATTTRGSAPTAIPTPTANSHKP